jgi:hypothetical protein
MVTNEDCEVKAEVGRTAEKIGFGMTGKTKDARVLRVGEAIETCMVADDDDNGLWHVPTVRFTINSGDKTELNLQNDPICNSEDVLTMSSWNPSEITYLGSTLYVSSKD